MRSFSIPSSTRIDHAMSTSWTARNRTPQRYRRLRDFAREARSVVTDEHWELRYLQGMVSERLRNIEVPASAIGFIFRPWAASRRRRVSRAYAPAPAQ